MRMLFTFVPCFKVVEEPLTFGLDEHNRVTILQNVAVRIF